MRPGKCCTCTKCQRWSAAAPRTARLPWYTAATEALPRYGLHQRSRNKLPRCHESGPWPAQTRTTCTKQKIHINKEVTHHSLTVVCGTAGKRGLTTGKKTPLSGSLRGSEPGRMVLNSDTWVGCWLMSCWWSQTNKHKGNPMPQTSFSVSFELDQNKKEATLAGVNFFYVLLKLKNLCLLVPVWINTLWIQAAILNLIDKTQKKYTLVSLASHFGVPMVPRSWWSQWVSWGHSRFLVQFQSGNVTKSVKNILLKVVQS